MLFSNVSWESAVNSMGDVRNRLCFVSVCGVRCETLFTVCFSLYRSCCGLTKTAVITIMVCVSADLSAQALVFTIHNTVKQAFFCRCFCVV